MHEPLLAAGRAPTVGPAAASCSTAGRGACRRRDTPARCAATRHGGLAHVVAQSQPRKERGAPAAGIVRATWYAGRHTRRRSVGRVLTAGRLLTWRSAARVSVRPHPPRRSRRARTARRRSRAAFAAAPSCCREPARRALSGPADTRETAGVFRVCVNVRCHKPRTRRREVVTAVRPDAAGAVVQQHRQHGRSGEVAVVLLLRQPAHAQRGVQHVQQPAWRAAVASNWALQRIIPCVTAAKQSARPPAPPPVGMQRSEMGAAADAGETAVTDDLLDKARAHAQAAPP